MSKLARLALLSMLLALAACGHEPPRGAAPVARGTAPGPAPAPARAAAAPLPGQRASYDDVDHYKEEVAEHIMRANAGYTFSGKLPPILPAIVVLRITVDANGRMTDVAIQRARHKLPSQVALASMKRAGILPKPQNLASAGRTLSFSETFLFNADDRFQLRTLAGPQ
jgi:periplasmic protein TonB